MFQLSLDRESAFNKRTFRHYCAKRKNGFVMGANCFAGTRAKKHLGGEGRQPGPIGAQWSRWCWLAEKPWP
jgi:hypothetical protein